MHTLGSGNCKELWTSWPEQHNAAIENGTILLFRVFSSVGNLFITLRHLMKVIDGVMMGSLNEVDLAPWAVPEGVTCTIMIFIR